MDDYNAYSIMQLPAFWQGAINARAEPIELMTIQSLNLHKLLSIAERGENVLNSEEFKQWLGYSPRRTTTIPSLGMVMEEDC